MVKKMQFILAGFIAALLAIPTHPLWLTTVDYWSYAVWLYWGLGITFMLTAGGLSLIGKFDFLQYLLGIWGLLWFALWFLQCFPTFTISL